MANDNHYGRENGEEQSGPMPDILNANTIRMGVFAAALIGALIGILAAPKSWRSRTGGLARSAGGRLGPAIWDMRERIKSRFIFAIHAHPVSPEDPVGPHTWTA